MIESWMPSESEIDNIGIVSATIDASEDSRALQYLMSRADYEDTKALYAKEKKVSEAKKKPKKSKDDKFTKVHKVINQKAVRDKMFNSSEKQMLWDLIPFCNLESNLITDEDGIPMSQKDIIDLIGWTKAHVIEVMAGLVDKNVLEKVIKGKSVFYRMNRDWYGH